MLLLLTQSEDCVGMISLMSGEPCSHPLLASLSSLNLLAEHEEMPVQVEESEQAMQVVPVTGIAAQ